MLDKKGGQKDTGCNRSVLATIIQTTLLMTLSGCEVVQGHRLAQGEMSIAGEILNPKNPAWYSLHIRLCTYPSSLQLVLVVCPTPMGGLDLDRESLQPTSRAAKGKAEDEIATTVVYCTGHCRGAPCWPHNLGSLSV